VKNTGYTRPQAGAFWLFPVTQSTKSLLEEFEVSKIAIVTDSCASIPEVIIKNLYIHWVPYYIHRGSELLRDLVTIQRADFYKWLPTADELPKTANPGPGDYLQMYEKLSKEGYDEIVSIHMTSKGSGAFQAALVAKEMIDAKNTNLKIAVIDTLNVSMCHSWMVIEAARAAINGASCSAVIQKVRSLIPITQMLQTADTLKYLYMGGRIGRAKHIGASLLDIKPIISMKDGVIVSLGQARSRNRVYKMIVDKVEEAVGYLGKIKVAYVHAAAREEVEKIKTLIEARLTCVESIIAELSPALGVHTGPGTVGLCYFSVD
jgi:DegV family protein with EDD domain